MADLTDLQAAQTVKLVGSDAAGVETNSAKVSNNQDLGTSDIMNNGGIDRSLPLTTAAKLGVVNVDGVTPLVNRKYFIMEGLDTGIKWGFSATTQSFDIFKSQVIMVPCGPNTTIYFKMTTGTGNVAIGEVS